MDRNWPELELGVWQRVVFFELAVEADGSISNTAALPAGWQEMGRAAARCGTAFDLAFTMFDAAKFEQLFTSVVSRQALLDSIRSLIEATGANGVHLDFEMYKPVTSEAVTGFRHFVQDMRRQLDAGRARPVMSIFGVVGAAQDLLDKKTIEALDYIVIQGYDAHWKEGDVAGPIAPLKGAHPLAWQKSLQHYLKLGARRSRILFSIPYFAYEWPVISSAPGARAVAPARELSYAPLPSGWVPDIQASVMEQVARYGFDRHAETGSPFYAYQDGQGSWWQGWFEDEASLAEKLAFAKREKLAGVAAFPLGYDAGRFNAILRKASGKRRSCVVGTPPGSGVK